MFPVGQLCDNILHPLALINIFGKECFSLQCFLKISSTVTVDNGEGGCLKTVKAEDKKFF